MNTSSSPATARSRRERSSTRWSNTVGASAAVSSALVIVVAVDLQPLAQLRLGLAHRRAGFLQAALHVLGGEITLEFGAHRMPLRAFEPHPQPGEARSPGQTITDEPQQVKHSTHPPVGESHIQHRHTSTTPDRQTDVYSDLSVPDTYHG